MFEKWIRRATPNPMTELETLALESPDRLAYLVHEELAVADAMVLLMALPADLSESIFSNLSDERAESFTHQASQLRHTDVRTRATVVTNALALARQKTAET